MSSILTKINTTGLDITTECLVATYTACGEQWVGVQPRLSNLFPTAAVICFRLMHADSEDNELADSDLCARGKSSVSNTSFGTRYLGPVFLSKGEKLKLLAKSDNANDTNVTASVTVLNYNNNSTEPIYDKNIAHNDECSGGEIFLSYAKKDSKWRDELLTMLKPVLSSKTLDIWYDGRIKPSQDWRREIEAALQRARVGVLLVSKHFLASEFITNDELPYLIESANKAKVKLSWALISESMYEEEQFAKIQALHDLNKPLSAFRGNCRDKALKIVGNNILGLLR